MSESIEVTHVSYEIILFISKYKGRCLQYWCDILAMNSRSPFRLSGKGIVVAWEKGALEKKREAAWGLRTPKGEKEGYSLPFAPSSLSPLGSGGPAKIQSEDIDERRAERTPKKCRRFFSQAHGVMFSATAKQIFIWNFGAFRSFHEIGTDQLFLNRFARTKRSSVPHCYWNTS